MNKSVLWRSTVVFLLVLQGCLGSRPELVVFGVGGQAAGGLSVGDVVTFGQGPLEAKNGSVTVVGAMLESLPDSLTLVEGVFLLNPDENDLQEAGITYRLASEAFRTLHEAKGVQIEPGQRWFLVLTLKAERPGDHEVGDIIVSYESEDDTRSLRVPTEMTLKVRE